MFFVSLISFVALSVHRIFVLWSLPQFKTSSSTPIGQRQGWNLKRVRVRVGDVYCRRRHRSLCDPDSSASFVHRSYEYADAFDPASPLSNLNIPTASVAVRARKVTRWQNLIPSFPWIAPGWRAWGAQFKERKGSNLAAQRSGAIVQKPERAKHIRSKNPATAIWQPCACA